MASLPLRLIAVLLLVATTGCAGLDSNPLLGRWVATTPALPGVTLGTYEFRRGSMTALGMSQPVDYSISDEVVLVTPRSGPGIGLEIELVDRDTARANLPVLGGLVTLRRVRDRGWF